MIFSTTKNTEALQPLSINFLTIHLKMSKKCKKWNNDDPSAVLTYP